MAGKRSPANEVIEDQRCALQIEFDQRGLILQKVDSHELDRLGLEYERDGHARTLEMVLSWEG